MPPVTYGPIFAGYGFSTDGGTGALVPDADQITGTPPTANSNFVTSGVYTYTQTMDNGFNNNVFIAAWKIDGVTVTGSPFTSPTVGPGDPIELDVNYIAVAPGDHTWQITMTSDKGDIGELAQTIQSTADGWVSSTSTSAIIHCDDYSAGSLNAFVVPVGIATKWQIGYRVTGIGGYTLISGLAFGSNHTITGLSPSTTYDLQIWIAAASGSYVQLEGDNQTFTTSAAPAATQRMQPGQML